MRVKFLLNYKNNKEDFSIFIINSSNKLLFVQNDAYEQNENNA